MLEVKLYTVYIVACFCVYKTLKINLIIFFEYEDIFLRTVYIVYSTEYMLVKMWLCPKYFFSMVIPSIFSISNKTQKCL